MLEPPKACNFIKKRAQLKCFRVNYVKFLRTASLTEHLRRLLLWYLLQNI